MKKQPKITAATRNAFIEAFFVLYEKKPIEKISIRELSEKAGYNRSTFYQYFKDIYDLFYQIEDDMVHYMKEIIGQHIGKNHPEEVFISVFSTIFREKSKYFHVIFNQTPHNHFSQKLKEEMVPLFAEKMNFPIDQPQTQYLLDFYFSGILSVFRRKALSPQDMTQEEFAKLIKSIVDGMQRSGLFPNNIE